MLKKEVIKQLNKHNLKWEDFIEWMIGQTHALTPDGKPDYYEWDVRRFINNNK